jgi:RNA polymerase sigma-70 factor (ECF subfamily)
MRIPIWFHDMLEGLKDRTASPPFERVQASLAAGLPELLPQLWRFSLRLTGNAADAEELVQRSSVLALERRSDWRNSNSRISWLYGIAHSIWRDDLRPRRLRQSGRLNIDEQSQVRDERNPDLEAYSALVVGGVNRLPEAQRTVVLLIAVESLSYAEACEILRIPVTTLIGRYALARQAIGRRFMLDVPLRQEHRFESQ